MAINTKTLIMKKIYYSKYFPRLFFKKYDGGNDSGVVGYFLIEWKILFSIGILHFKEGTKEAYHNHAFNALTWWLFGAVTECKLNATYNGKNKLIEKFEDIETEYLPSLIPKFTSRNNFHKVKSHKNTFALTFRSCWKDVWQEERGGKIINLTHSRRELT